MNKHTLNSLKDVILYFSNGSDDFPILSYSDDKEIKTKYPNNTYSINMNRLDSDLCYYLNFAEKQKRSLCFYPNGSNDSKYINEIRWHFVDIDEGDKEKQYERILSAPLRPTLVYRGRAGHKLLYRVTNAIWDNSCPKKLNQSILIFKNIQQQLIEYFNGDGKLVSPNNALRLPYTKNYKYWRKEIVEEEIVLFEPENIYTQEELSKAFPPAKKIHNQNKEVNFEGLGEEKEEVVRAFVDLLDTMGLTYIDYGDRLAFQCPLHDDSSPSGFMFKDNLIIHCSTGQAYGHCPIERGKPIEWVAEQLDAEELKEAYKKLLKRSEQKYRDIRLESMTADVSIPLHSPKNILIDGIIKEMENEMQKRGIIVDQQSELVYQNILDSALSFKKQVLSVPMPPGGGKSTLVEVMLKYLLKQDINMAGAVIAVERIETAKKLAKSIGQYEIWLDGPGIDIPRREFKKAAYVMESAFTSELCKKKQGIEEYVYGICRDCSEKKVCPIAQKYREQKRYPIVIVSHTRLAMDKDRLSNYKEWVDVNGNKHERRLLIIDEKPPLVTVQNLTLSDINEFEYEIHNMSYEIEGVNEVKELIKKVKDLYYDKLLPDHEVIPPIQSTFQFNFRKVWFQSYTGKNPYLIDKIEHFIQNGGRISRGNNQINIVTHKVLNYEFENFNTIILDGTSNIDMEYKLGIELNILHVPKIRTYENLTFYKASISMSKQALRKNPERLDDLVKYVRKIAEEENVLVLCYKEYRNTLEKLLEPEIKKGGVKLNHFGNVKGSNNYNDCTSLVLAGVQHKGHPYYIAKFDALYGACDDTETNTINDVIRFKNIDLERLKLNDQLVDLIQDICRIKVRNKDSTEPVKVYIPTKDKVLINLLNQYFTGSTIRNWDISDYYTEWYHKLDQLFENMQYGQIIQKGEIREFLNLTGESGKRQFTRMQQKEIFSDLLKKHNMVPVNNRSFKKMKIS
jgi:hypothetical protein